MSTITTFLKKHWVMITLITIAYVILHLEYNAICCPNRLQPIAVTNPFFVATSKWGIRFLLLSLLMSPLYHFTGWGFAVKLRKPLGLIAFFFVTVHVFLFVYNSGHFAGEYGWINHFGGRDFIILGIISFTILALMALTSFKFLMKRMGRWWKPLHRLVYAAGILGIAHGLLAATTGKRAGFGGQESAIELRVYLALLTILLVMRIPIVKHMMQVVSPFKSRKHKVKRRQRMSTSVS